MTNQVMVTKRDGSIEDFKVEKVKMCINWACENLSVNPLALEARFSEYLQEEVSSKSIQQNLIFSARTLASAEESDWIFVAGRLYTMQKWKETGAYDKTYGEFFKESVESGFYPLEDIYEYYTQEQINEVGDWIDQSRDLAHSYGSIFNIDEKWLTDKECVQQALMTTCLIIASQDPPEERMEKVKEYYDALSFRQLSVASPWLLSLRFKGNISSCFIIQPEDNLESIFENVTTAAMISKKGGGLGISLSRIRAMGSEIAGRKNASKGVCGWSRIFNDVALFVDQGGKRPGAFTVEVPIWHRDIGDFLHIQSEVGDIRTKAYDIFPQIGMYDLFMKLDKDSPDNKWYTFCPHEVKSVTGIELYNLYGQDFEKAYKKCVKEADKGNLKIVKVYRIRDLFKTAMTPMFESGLPYVAFLDTINNDNPNDHEGTIPCVNLCNESFSVVKPDEETHTCNLISVVAGRVESKEHLEYLVSLATRILDNGIALTNPPVETSRVHNLKYRTVGVGIQGLADYLAKNFKTYADTQFIQDFAEVIQYSCVKESIKLAKERGEYPAFKGSRWDTGKQIEKYSKSSNVYGKSGWQELQNQIDLYGIRNSQLTSPAPNTSTAVFMDATAGVPPHYAGFFKKGVGSGQYPVAGMYLKQNPFFYAKNATKYDHKTLVDAYTGIQKFVDAGISTEYIFDHNDPNFNAKQLYDLIHYAHKKGSKAIYYIRHIKKGKSLNDEIGIESSACEGCAD